ncbi:MAG TPA: DNA-3-methyladenine glycosylase 2 family protein [Burkholderiales bacterium]|nr:DNA-3-methyladenine glycosylase 2 family protein [Burkholderiales bacterium]
MKPVYWEEAKRELSRRDPVVGEIIRRHPCAHLVARGDPFVTLARAIVGQQISVKAAQTVWDRVLIAVGQLSPGSATDVGARRLHACGLSRRKVEYLLDLAAHFSCGAIDPERWRAMGDEQVIAELTEVRGIGRWTAEMFLIFNLLRPDVLPLDDLGLRRAVSLSYRRGRAVSAGGIRRIAQAWQPWRSVATWYLWRSLDPVPVEY